MTSSFTRLLTKTATVKRAEIVSGKRGGTPETVISNLPCMPLMPVDAETRNRLALDTPHQLMQTMIPGTYSVRRGDVLTLEGVDYPVATVEPWPFKSGDPRTRLILEKLEV